MDRSKDLDLLLIGKTGNGKSRTGNTILGWKAFKFSASASSVTKDIVREVTEYGGRRIKVVDGPGVGDTSGSDEQANSFVMEQLAKAISINDKGYHSFILVVRFGLRFERNDKNAVDFLKAIFGPHFVEKYCILLFTCGDIFEEEHEGQTIHQWCQEQSGPLKELYEECDQRVVLFDNRTENAKRRTAQVDELITMVDTLCVSGMRYTNKHFEKAKVTRERWMLKDKTALLDLETMDETSLILQELNKIHQLEKLGERKGQLQQLHTRCDALFQKLKTEDKGTGVLNKLLKTVTDIRQTLNSEIDKCSRTIGKKEIVTRQDEQLKERARTLRGQGEVCCYCCYYHNCDYYDLYYGETSGNETASFLANHPASPHTPCFHSH